MLLPVAGPIPDVDAALARRLDTTALRAAVADVPDEWLAGEPGFDSVAAVRAAYLDVLTRRLVSREAWVPQLEGARARL